MLQVEERPFFLYIMCGKEQKSAYFWDSCMNLRKYLTTRTIKLSLAGETPEEIMREMVELLCAAGKIDSKHIDDAVKALMRREKMIQQEAPLPWRQAEMRYIIKALGLEEELSALTLVQE